MDSPGGLCQGIIGSLIKQIEFSVNELPRRARKRPGRCVALHHAVLTAEHDTADAATDINLDQVGDSERIRCTLLRISEPPVRKSGVYTE
jgi:hypothetical protein